MSNFTCNKCGTRIIDTDKGYVTECEHYPLEDRRTRSKIPESVTRVINAATSEVKSIIGSK